MEGDRIYLYLINFSRRGWQARFYVTARLYCTGQWDPRHRASDMDESHFRRVKGSKGPNIFILSFVESPAEGSSAGLL
jgi:hypothetical protein